MWGQLDRARGLDRNSLLDRNQKHRDDAKIPLVLTYHPALHRVYGVLQTCLNALFVHTGHKKLFKDTEHQQLFKDKLLFRSEGPTISRILWFGPKFTKQQMNKLKRALLMQWSEKLSNLRTHC